jgi:hypothetical protein
MKLKARNIHRDFGYFYVGLIIAFSISGILQNHRQNWHPERYTVETKNITVPVPLAECDVNEAYIEQFSRQFEIKDKFRRQSVKKNVLKLSYEKHDVEIDLGTGKGEIVAYQKTPFLSQFSKLHKDTSVWWIYYSDVFGLSLLVIAVTGMIMIPKGRFSFKERGWKLALAGLVFPLIFLFLIS